MSQFISQSSKVGSSVFTEHERLVIEFWLEHPKEATKSNTPLMDALAALGFRDASAYQYGLPSAAVARIALAAVESHLPQWARCSGDNITLGRDVRSRQERFARAVQLRSRFLFSLDWAATAPGVSWPRDYYATWFPGYRVWVITASSDTNDLWGVLDVSIGWFHDSQQFDEGVHDALLPAPAPCIRSSRVPRRPRS